MISVPTQLSNPGEFKSVEPVVSLSLGRQKTQLQSQPDPFMEAPPQNQISKSMDMTENTSQAATTAPAAAAQAPPERQPSLRRKVTISVKPKAENVNAVVGWDNTVSQPSST